MAIDPGTCTEQELTTDVALCTPDGLLNREAVGWSRTPVHDCALPGSWGRRKRWDFWGLIGPGCAMNITYADVDYLGLVDVWFCDLVAGESMSKSIAMPFANSTKLPDRVAGGPMRMSNHGFSVSISEEPNGTRLRATTKNFEADVLVVRPDRHESLSVVIPWSDKRFQYTNKDVSRPAAGRVTWNGRTYDLMWGTLDFGRGKWPYRTHWNWGAGAAMVNGIRVGLQLGGKWTLGTGMTENALCIDGRLSKLSEELVWTYDTSDWLRPWTIRTPRSDRVDLVFTPVYDKRSKLSLGFAASSVDQCFGTYAGTIVPDDGRRLSIEGVFGWAEEATWRW